MKPMTFCALWLIGAFLGASSASAGSVRVTYTGTVSYGYDETGPFGPPGTDLEGESYQATFLFDLNGQYDYKSYGTDTISSSGGLPRDGDNPFVLATITINGHNVTAPGGDVGSLNWADDGDSLGSSTYYAMYSTLAQMVDSITTSSAAFPLPTENGLIYRVPPTDSQYAIFNFNGVMPGVPLDFVNAHGAADISTVTVTVPEPSTWAMLVLGFSGLGFMRWRDSRKITRRSVETHA